MSRKMQSIIGKVGLVVLVAAVIGVGAYFSKKNNSPADSASLQQQQEQGKTLYVAQDGNDANAGTKDAPLKTVGGAVNSAKEGDTIVVPPRRPVRTSGG